MKQAIISFILELVILAPLQFQAQQKTITNRYAMKMQQTANGKYELQQEDKYRKNHIDISMPDVLEPYTPKYVKLNSKMYKGVATQDIVFKKYKDYELKITVDKAVSDKPTPFMIYIHGGGWARGDNSSSKVISQYLAKQHGITGFRIEYTLAPQSGASVQVSISDVMDALKYIQDHARELNVDPNIYGFLGTSAGAHLAAVGAMKSKAKLFIGYSGIYDLEKAAITSKTHDPQRIKYFKGELFNASPINMIPKKNIPACMLVCGTADVTVECEQSKMFADALKQKGGKVELDVYEHYDHNLSSRTSDKMEDILFKSVDFVDQYLK